MDIEKMQASRSLFLMKLYETTKGNIWADPTMYEIGSCLHFPESETDNIVDYLRLKGFVKILSKRRDISITVEGIDEAERLFTADNQTYSKDEIKELLEKILAGQALQALAQEMIYDMLMDISEKNNKIQKKDIKMMIISKISSYSIDIQQLSLFLGLD